MDDLDQIKQPDLKEGDGALVEEELVLRNLALEKFR